MGLLDSFIQITDDEKKEQPIKKVTVNYGYGSPAQEFLGKPLYAIDCRGSNLFVHEKAVVIDRTRGGLWNAGDGNFKVIPFKSIVSIQAKLENTLLTGYIEFETANSSLSNGRGDKAERRSENSVILSTKKERAVQAKEALNYIFQHII